MKYKAIAFCSIMIFLSSCSSKTSFKHYYKENKTQADHAFAFPKYLAIVAVPKESKKDIQRFSQGMRKIRLLVDEDSGDDLISSFKSFSEGKNYTPYLVVKKDGSEINLFAKEEGDYIKEIVLDIKSEDGSYVIGLLGKMTKQTFQSALSEASKK